MEKILATPELTHDQCSITEVPRQLYQSFYKKKIGTELKTETNGEIRLWFELPTESETEKVIAIFTELFDGDAVKTRFALLSWYPPEEEFRASYDFEIFSEPQSRGWSHSEGSRFVEGLFYKTKNSIYEQPLIANHPLVDYVSQALIKMRQLMRNQSIVCQEFIDNAKRPPR